VEGGAELLQSFITQNLWDEARVFSSPKPLGTGYAAPHLPAVKTVENREYAGEWVHIFKPVDRK
ncbi:MAG: dihydrofolate reductase family protein, partial [Bacteroidales bacterium]|nr:dihydrofolate reductase family protein [Bacteroidales bacterium]